jgi:chemotaxis protein CheC
MVMKMKTALQLVDVLLQVELGTTKTLDDTGKSCLQETGNIISSSFVNSWAKWLDITTEPGAPSLLVDMPEALFDAVLVEQAMASDDVLMAKTEFSVDGRWLEWDFYLLPTPASMRLIEASCS